MLLDHVVNRCDYSISRCLLRLLHFQDEKRALLIPKDVVRDSFYHFFMHFNHWQQISEKAFPHSDMLGTLNTENKTNECV
jgi:hypothetical protein